MQVDQLDVQLMHVFRESNRTANWLANEGYRDKILFFEGCVLRRLLRGLLRFRYVRDVEFERECCNSDFFPFTKF